MKTSLFSLLCVLALASFGTAQTITIGSLEDFDGAGVVAGSTSSCNTTTGTRGTFPTGWANDTSVIASWTIDAGGTTSTSTGPSVDFTSASATGQYIYVETSGTTATCTGAQAIMNLPPLDPAGASNPTLSFALHMFGATMGSFVVEQQDPTGAWQSIFSRSGDQGDAWGLVNVTIVPTAPTVAIRFNYTIGTSFTGDIAIDDVSFQDGVRPTEWNTNTDAASFAIDDTVVASSLATSGAVAINNVTLCPAPLPIGPAVGSYALGSNIPNGAYDIMGNGNGLLARSQGGLQLVSNDIVNLDLSAGLTSLNGGGPAITFQALPGSSLPGSAGASFTVPYSLTAALVSSYQGVFLNPSSALGLTLSQATQFVVTAGPPNNIAGPTAVSGTTLVPLSGGSSCLTSSGFSFYGTNYNSLNVISNGRIMFGGSDVDSSPTMTDALNDVPFIAPLWTDLDPSEGGSITVSSPAFEMVRVEWVNVPYNSEGVNGATVSFSVTLDAATGAITFDGLSGIMPNPSTGATTPSTLDSQFMGICAGNSGGATDGGLTTFAAGGTGTPSVATDMIYDFVAANTAGVGFSLPSLATPGLNGIIFSPAGATYTWIGL